MNSPRPSGQGEYIVTEEISMVFLLSTSILSTDLLLSPTIGTNYRQFKQHSMWAPVGPQLGPSWAPNGPRTGLTGAHLGMLLGLSPPCIFQGGPGV